MMLDGSVAVAADIQAEEQDIDGQKVTFITVEGELLAGDERRFANVAIKADSALVFLSSPGGNLVAGIEVGKAIRLKGFATIVPENYSCASACALAWLGGVPRFMEKGATIGFHAAFDKSDSGNTLDAAANAIVGAYLNQLGLQTAAIVYITETKPSDIRWLTLEDAEAIGLEVRLFEEAEQPSGQRSKPPTFSDGPIRLQLGSFHSEAAARNAARLSMATAPILLGDLTSYLEVDDYWRTYNAGYEGFANRESAVAACAELNAADIGCVVLPLPSPNPLETASPEEIWKACEEDPDSVIVIAACSGIIKVGKDRASRLAIAHNRRGIANYFIGDYRGALADLDRAIEIVSGVGLFHFNRGRAHRRLLDYKKALADFKIAVSVGDAAAPWYRSAVERVTELEQTMADEWRTIATPFDISRLDHMSITRDRAIKEEAERDPEYSEVRAMVESETKKVELAGLAGRWRCRTIKLGGILPFTVYAYFDCEIEGNKIRKITGSQRFSGLLYDGSEGLVFLGTEEMRDLKPIDYGTDPDRNMIGLLRPLGKDHLALELPSPIKESAHDVIEFVRK